MCGQGKRIKILISDTIRVKLIILIISDNYLDFVNNRKRGTNMEVTTPIECLKKYFNQTIKYEYIKIRKLLNFVQMRNGIKCYRFVPLY